MQRAMTAPPISRTVRAPTDEERALGGPRAVLGIAAAAIRIPAWLAAAPGGAQARSHERRFFARLLRGCGVDAVVEGVPAPAPGTLTVANHVSWADIPLLASVLGTGFVAKSEIAGWPLIGRFARRLGCVFVARERRGDVGDQAGEIAARLAERGIVLFPEGTTGDGATLLPFRTSLFVTARAARRVQPVAILYRAADGGVLPRERLAEIAWGDEGLLDSAARFVRRRRHARLVFLPPIEGAILSDRKALSAAARAAIERAMARG